MLNNSLPFIPLLWFNKFKCIDTEEQEIIPKSCKEGKKKKIMYQLCTHLQKFRVSGSGVVPFLEENQTKKG